MDFEDEEENEDDDEKNLARNRASRGFTESRESVPKALWILASHKVAGSGLDHDFRPEGTMEYLRG